MSEREVLWEGDDITAPPRVSVRMRFLKDGKWQWLSAAGRWVDGYQPESREACRYALLAVAGELRDRDAALRVAEERAQKAEAWSAVLGAALLALHDECSVLKSGKRLNYGPMMAPGEDAVLQARMLLDLRGAGGTHE